MAMVTTPVEERNREAVERLVEGINGGDVSVMDEVPRGHHQG